LEVGDLPVPRAEHPERVEDDGHAGEPHDGVGRLERRLHAAPHHPPRHADADRSNTCLLRLRQPRALHTGSLSEARRDVTLTNRGGENAEVGGTWCCGRLY
jgi:hypothetical protein